MQRTCPCYFAAKPLSRPGVRFSRLAYSAGLLRPEIIRDLDLARFGYEVHAFDPQFFLPFLVVYLNGLDARPPCGAMLIHA